MVRDIAIIGMNGRFPRAKNIIEFQKNLERGINCIDDIGHERRVQTNLGEMQFRKAAFLEEVDKFDHSFFGISKAEADYMDPNHRILLEVVYGIFENAGYNVDDFSNSNTGVFISNLPSSYYSHIDENAQTIVSGNLTSMIAGRISRYFNLTGNAVVVDTACSSSLVSLNLACNAILIGDLDQAIVGASALNLFPAQLDEGIDVGIFSPTSEVAAFSANANGTVGGEACVGILIKPLDKAIEDNDNIQAVIKSVAVNQDANRSSFITAPSKVAQEEVIIDAWKKANIDPMTIEFIEAHGTGTKIGDPIEFDALTRAFKKYTPQDHFCFLSSVKTNIGHTDVAAGLTGLIKAVLSIKNKVLFPSLNFSSPNPLINFIDTALMVNKELKPWAEPVWKYRRAGVSSFGFSGTNCHVVLEESPVRNKNNYQENRQYPLTLSSQTAEGVRKQALDIVHYLEQNSHLSLKDVCYTLSVGRKHYPFRYGINTQDTKSLIANLKKDVLTEDKVVDTKKAYHTQVFTLFPHLKINYAKALDLLLQEFPAAGEAKKSFDKLDYSHIKPKKRIKNFIFQFCLFKTLESFGLNLSQIIGIGTGDILIDVITKNISLQDGINRLAVLKDIPQSDELRFNDFIHHKITEEQGNVKLLILGAKEDFQAPTTKDDWLQSLDNVDIICSNGALNSLVPVLNYFYLNGGNIKWQSFFGKNNNRLELPLYNFKKTRCWFNALTPDKPSSLNDNLIHDISWEKVQLVKSGGKKANKNFIIFSFEEHLSIELLNEIKLVGGSHVFVYCSTEFKKYDPSKYTIDSSNLDDFKKLRIEFKNSNNLFDSILFIGPNINIGHDLSVALVESLMDSCLITYFNFIKTFSDVFGKNLNLTFITFNANIVSEDEKGNPFHNVAITVSRSLVSDYPEMQVKAIDVDYHDISNNMAKRILAEIDSSDLLRFVTFRKADRYVQVVKQASNTFSGRMSLSSNGVYLITGGLSGLGFELAKRINVEFGVREIVILGKTNLLENTNKQSVMTRIEKLNALEKLYSKIHYFNVDLGAFDQVASVFEKIKTKIYRLDGIFHLAGLPGNRVPVKKLEIESFIETLSPKLSGTLALHHFTWSLNPKFFVCFSSLNSIVPLKNSLDYTIANGFQDAYAKASNSKITKFYSINWPGWNTTGMSVESHSNENSLLASDDKLKLMDLDQGFDVLFKIMGQNKCQVLVGDIDWTSFKINPFFDISSTDAALPVTNTPPTAISDIAGQINGFTATEKVVWSIWFDVLKEEGIELNSDFFDIGGNSLNGIQVINAISEQLGQEIEFEDIFDFPTVKEMAAYLDNLSNEGMSSKIEEIPVLEEQSYYGISSTQKRFWVLDHFGEVNAGYNLIWASELLGELDTTALSMSIENLIEKYEILRTVYDKVDNEPVQIINPVEEKNWLYLYHDITKEEDKTQQANQLFKEAEQHKFNLKTGPLVRATLIKLEDSKHLFSLSMPHICTDAWSTNLINNQIRTLYNVYASNGINSLVLPRNQYKDFAAWQSQLLTGENYEKLHHYWTKKFEGNIPKIDFPTDFIRPTVKSYKGNVHNFELKGDLYEGFCELAQKTEVSHFMMLIACVKLLIFKYTNQTEIVIGTPIAGRIHYNLEDQLGCFLNMLPLKTIFDINGTFSSQLTKIKKMVLEAFEHQSYPFDVLVKDLNIQRDPGRMPLFDITIGYQNSGNIVKEEVIVADLEIKAYKPERMASTFDLSFDFIESADRIFVEIEYDTKLYLPETIYLIQYRFIKMLNILIQNYNLPLSEITAMLISDEQKDLEFNTDLNLDEAF